jgi:lipoprotein-anchoring transpeptidase ErfK/SrfK
MPAPRVASRLVAALGVLALAGCVSPPVPAPASVATTPTPTATATPPPPVPGPFSLAVTPASGADNRPVSTEIGLRLRGGRLESVVLRPAGATGTVAGAVRPDGSSWVPAAPLEFGRAYTATVTARSTDGARTLRRTTSFTTMARPWRETGTGLYLFTGRTYGVAMPVVVEFHPAVPPSARAGVQRRLFVTSDPPQPGVWHWASGSQAFYRPPEYWKPGTTLTVRSALRGHPMGEGRYGDVDRSATVRIGPKFVMDADNATKRMSVYADDVLVRTIKVSLGKPSTPSSSGHMVVMAKHYQTVFDTRGEGPDGYRIDINYAMRLTWGGEFVHAAPWSVSHQGVRNVSHGCVNMSWANAEWLFGRALIGDPVIVRGTEVRVAGGNGWTAWDLPWSRYIRGSALPVPPELAAYRPPRVPGVGRGPLVTLSV